MKSKLNWLEVVLLAAPFVALAIYWNELPERVPIHWNLRGEINGWASKEFGLLSLPLLSLGTIVLLHILPWFDPKLRKNPAEESRMSAVLPILRIVSLLLFDTIFFVQIATSLGRNVAGGRIIVTCLLVFFVILGNYLGNLRSNYFRWHPHPVDARKSRDLAGNASLGRAPDVFRRAHPFRRAIFSQ